MTIRDPANHSPGRIFYEFLIDQNLCGAYDAVSGWKGGFDYHPDTKDTDNRLTCFTTTPSKDGVNHITGRSVMKHGVTVRIESVDHKEAYKQSMIIKTGIEKLCRQSVVIEGLSYTMHRAVLLSGPILLGKQQNEKFAFNLNYLLSITIDVEEN